MGICFADPNGRIIPVSYTHLDVYKRQPYIRQTVKNPTIDPAQIAPLLQQRCEVLTDIPEKVDFFDALPEYDLSLIHI